MKWWVGLLPYFAVRAFAFKYCETANYDGMIYYKSVGDEWICRKEALKGQQHDK